MNIKLEVIRLANNDVISTSCNRKTHYALMKAEIQGTPIIVDVYLQIDMAAPDYKYTYAEYISRYNSPEGFLPQGISEINEITNYTGQGFSGKITNTYYYENGHYHLCDGDHYVQTR